MTHPTDDELEAMAVRLDNARLTMTNDDTSQARTDKRARFINRLDATDEAAAMLRAMKGRAVKPLEWQDHPACDGPVLAKAVTLLGTYFIVDDTDDFSGLYLDLISHDDARWWQSVRATSTHIEEGWRGDVESLKNKAQADYDARILAALEPALDHSDWDAAIEAAAKVAREMADLHGPNGSEASIRQLKKGQTND